MPKASWQRPPIGPPGSTAMASLWMSCARTVESWSFSAQNSVWQINRRLDNRVNGTAVCASEPFASPLRLKPLPQPPPHAREIPIRPGHELPRSARLAVLQIGELRIDEQACGCRESRSPRRVAETADAERAADAHLPAQHVGCEV